MSRTTRRSVRPVRAADVTRAVRDAWAGAGLKGHVYCRRVPGYRQDAWIVHHGQGGVTGTDASRQRFVSRCRRALARLDVEGVLELEWPEERARLHGHWRPDLERMLRMAWIAADRVPEPEWPKDAVWEPVCATGDVIEMWEKAVQRCGDLYRVVIGSYDTYRLGATCRDDVMYVGGERGARLYSGFA